MPNHALSIDILLEATSGGAARHSLDLFENLIERHHDVRLIYSVVRADDLFYRRIAGFDPSRLFEVKLQRSPHTSDISAFKHIRRLAAFSKRKRILHSHSTKAGFIATMVRGSYASSVFTPHAYRGMDPTMNGFKKSVLGRLEYLISVGHDKIIAVSPEERDYAIAIGLKPSKVIYIPNGVNLPADDSPNGGKTNWAASGLVVGFVGRLAYQKNPITFLKCIDLVLKIRPDVRAVIIGDGPLRGQIDEYIAQNNLGSYIKCLGGIDFLQNLERVQILVHTSFYESLPYVLLEACAAGIPIVTVLNAGSKAIFLHSSRLIEDPFDANLLAAAVLEVVGAESVFKQYEAESRTAGKKFSISKMVDNIESLYSEL